MRTLSFFPLVGYFPTRPLLLSALAIASSTFAGTAAPVAAAQPDVELQIGVIQRFGEKTKDTMTINALPGDQLTVRFSDGQGQPQTITTPTLKLETVMQPLSAPVVDERVVFSTHRSFETAEERAREWQAKGLEVEVAQPDRWQVWAKRSIYKTPVVRRQLLDSLKTAGLPTAHIDSKILKEVPRMSFVVNGYRYTRDRLEVFAGRGMAQVDREKDDIPKHTFGGSLRLQPNAYGTTTVVNLVPLETYLRGVVPHELGTGAPPAAMAAQAIMARTYVLRNLRRFAIDGYQLCATTQCQVYFGLDGVNGDTDRAITVTKGLVATYNNELVDALYSSTTGGVTSAYHEVWRGAERPYLQAKIDADKPVWDIVRAPLTDENNFRQFIGQKQGFNESDQSSYFRWKEESSLTRMGQDLKKYLTSIRHPLANFQTIQQVQVVQRASSGRVFKLAIQTDRGVVELERDESLLAFDAPNSLLFYLDPVLDDKRQLKGYTFVGGGLGHGVGLSQYGSYHLGKIGYSYEQILNFYFPGTLIQPVNPSITFWREAR
jgi:SpoIID/LytB domain protein